MALKRRTKNFLDKVIEKPELSNGEAWAATHKTNNLTAASKTANKILKKPEAISYLKEHLREAEETVIDVMQTSRKLRSNPQHGTLALKSATSVIDRVTGYANPTTNRGNNYTFNQINLDSKQDINSKFASFIKGLDKPQDTPTPPPE